MLDFNQMILTARYFLMITILFIVFILAIIAIWYMVKSTRQKEKQEKKALKRLRKQPSSKLREKNWEDSDNEQF